MHHKMTSVYNLIPTSLQNDSDQFIMGCKYYICCKLVAKQMFLIRHQYDVGIIILQ